MQEKSTIKSGYILSSVIFLVFSMALFLTGFTATSQTYCANETIIWSENFGNGTTATTLPNVINLGFQPTGSLNDGYYRIVNNTHQRPEWHNTVNHTPTGINGKMLVVNGNGQPFYTRILTNASSGFAPASYSASLFLINVNTPGTCGPEALLPTITFIVEYNVSSTGTTGWVQLQSAVAASVPQSASATWIQLGGVFNLPVLAQRMRLTIADGTTSGCGNDYAIDDIQFGTCPEGGPLPVEFLSISAFQKGGGVAVNFSTASESNNKYFDVEKSVDGANWTTVNSIIAAGNSNLTRSYSSYDANPVSGFNYYRIKQVDNDGKFKYSSIAKVKISIEKTGVTILTNPFVNAITVDFLSKNKQAVSVKLTDMSGKLIALEKWQIANGSTRLNLNKVANIQTGMYIFTVIDENGIVIFNNKLIKQ